MFGCSAKLYNFCYFTVQNRVFFAVLMRKYQAGLFIHGSYLFLQQFDMFLPSESKFLLSPLYVRKHGSKFPWRTKRSPIKFFTNPKLVAYTKVAYTFFCAYIMLINDAPVLHGWRSCCSGLFDSI